MLDDLKYIHERDVRDTLGIAEKQWQQLEHTFDFTITHTQPIDNIVYAGMGGSALAAILSESWPGYQVPYEVCRNYDIPAYVGPNTLFVAASYSGNTEETLSAIEQAAQKNAQIIVIAGGGKLQAIAAENNYPFLLLPKAVQPRYVVLYNLKALVTILERFNLVVTADAEKSLHEAAEFLKKSVQSWLPTVPTKENHAKQLALECIGKSPVIYGGPLMSPVAYKWKIGFNENAKNVAWYGQLPEFNHNEFMGWTKQPNDKPYTTIDLRSTFEHQRVQKRFIVSDKLLSGMRPAAEVVNVQGDTLLEQLLWGIVYGDFVTIYTALLNGVNPAPVDLIEKFKKELSE